jgi:hypothetical protein
MASVRGILNIQSLNELTYEKRERFFMVHDVPVRSCYLLLLSCAVVTCTIWASIGERLPSVLHGTDAGIGSRGAPWYGAIRATPSLPTQTGPAPPREDATCTSGRESRGSAGSPRRRQAAHRARDARAAARPGRRLAGRRVGGARGRAKGARGEGRAEFDSRRAYGTHSRNPCTSTAIIPPPLPASRLEGGSTSAGVGARRALGIVAAIWGRRGMVGGTAVINQALQGRHSHPSQSYLRMGNRFYHPSDSYVA